MLPRAAGAVLCPRHTTFILSFGVNNHCLGPQEEGSGGEWVFPGAGTSLGHWVWRAQEPKGFLEQSPGAELLLPQTGLMLACYHGFGSVVALLSRCPFLDVNQQDKEGDTALMLAVQAGARLPTPPSARLGHSPTLFA